MLVDSHCHLHMLDLDLFDNSLDNVINQAKANDVGYFLCVSTQLDEYDKLAEIAGHYPEVGASVGIHPNEDFTEEESVTHLRQLADQPHIIAIGETGLDYYRTEGIEQQQKQHERFEQHIDVAKTLNKPLIIHSRAAAEDTIAILKQTQAGDVGGVMHCFCETWEVAEQALTLGFYISISGIVTFKNAASLQEVARKVPMDRMLIETDCPYLAPTPFRGKPNQPAYVRYVAEKIAELRGISYETVAETTTDNFFNCFTQAERPS